MAGKESKTGKHQDIEKGDGISIGHHATGRVPTCQEIKDR